jgi:hypothetical protein
VDATHIAIATVHGMAYLLTWNCAHIANATMRTRIETICWSEGYEPPVYARPKNLWRSELMAKDPIVEEVRRIRQLYAARFNYDLAAIFHDLKERQNSGEFTVVNRKPRRPTVRPDPSLKSATLHSKAASGLRV